MRTAVYAAPQGAAAADAERGGIGGDAGVFERDRPAAGIQAASLAVAAVAAEESGVTAVAALGAVGSESVVAQGERAAAGIQAPPLAAAAVAASVAAAAAVAALGGVESEGVVAQGERAVAGKKVPSFRPLPPRPPPVWARPPMPPVAVLEVRVSLLRVSVPAAGGTGPPLGHRRRGRPGPGRWS